MQSELLTTRSFTNPRVVAESRQGLFVLSQQGGLMAGEETLVVPRFPSVLQSAGDMPGLNEY